MLSSLIPASSLTANKMCETDKSRMLVALFFLAQLFSSIYSFSRNPPIHTTQLCMICHVLWEPFLTLSAPQLSRDSYGTASLSPHRAAATSTLCRLYYLFPKQTKTFLLAETLACTDLYSTVGHGAHGIQSIPSPTDHGACEDRIAKKRDGSRALEPGEDATLESQEHYKYADFFFALSQLWALVRSRNFLET